MTRRLRNGFTIIEVLVAVLCVLVLLSVAIAATTVSQDAAQQAQCQANMGTITQGYTGYMTDNNGFIPPNADFNHYPDYQPASSLGGGEPGCDPPYMRRSPAAILDGPSAGPWYFMDKVGAYLSDQTVWICQASVAQNKWFTDPWWHTYEPYHPAVYTSFVQPVDLGYGSSGVLKRVEDLPGAPSDLFLMGHGAPAIIGGSPPMDNVYNLVPSLTNLAFVHSRSTVQDVAVEGTGANAKSYTMGLRGMLFTDMHVEMMHYWDMWNGTQGESTPGAGDAKYFMIAHDATPVSKPQ